MLELVKVSLLNGMIGSGGATLALFLFYLVKSKF